MRQAQIDTTFTRLLCVMQPEHLSELAQYLVALNIKLPKALMQALIRNKQVAYVVGCFLAPETSDIVQAFEFLNEAEGTDATQLEVFEMLVHSDIN